MSNIRIGIDVGGTNTDAVLLMDNKIVISAKTQTTSDVTTGIAGVIKEVLNKAQLSANNVSNIMIGTTHLLNATLQHHLNKVAIIRLGSPATTAIPPCTGWPEEIENNVKCNSYIIKGGYDYNGKLISDLDVEKIENIGNELKEKGVNLIAIIGVFSHVNKSQEIEAANILRKINPDFEISLSHQMGGLGLLERENATIINTALLPIYQKVCQGIQDTLTKIGLNNANIFLSHNDGTLEPIQHNTANEQQYKPISTLNAGPSNSMRGAAILAEYMHIKDLIVADIGGTSTDVGLIKDGAPIEENSFHEIAGIPFNFPNIRTHSIGLGGGSIIRKEQEKYLIGPKSVSNRLKELAICFGGNEFTATDIAVLKNRILINSANGQSGHYPDGLPIDMLDDLLHKKLADIVIEVWSTAKEKPKDLLLVGGGSKLFDRNKLLTLLANKIFNIIIPNNADVANALGAASGQICGMHSEIYDYKITSRDTAKKEAIEKAKKNAIQNGAGPNLTVKYINEQEIRYVVGIPTVVTVKVAGDIDDKLSFAKLTVSEKIEKNINYFPPREETNAKSELTHAKPPVSSKPTQQTSILPKHENIIDIKCIADMAIGCAFLGSGGGGDTRLAKLMVEDSIKNNKSFKRISLNDILDDATVICFGLMGSPVVLEEKLPSKEEIIKSIKQLEIILKKKIDVIITMEIGGANGLIHLLAAAELDIPFVDADCMGRAFPGINMVTPTIYSGVKNFIAVLGSATKITTVEAENAIQLENKARIAADDMGGIVFLAYSPMKGKIAKQVCIDGTLYIAQTIGSIFNSAKSNGQCPLPLINEYLQKTEYEKITEIFSGRIEDICRKEESGFSVGGIVINNNVSQVEIIFQNEYLLARIKIKENFYKELAIVPHLIVVADYETLVPISCGQLKYGQQVRILTMNAPKKMLTDEAKAIVGPQAYDLNKLISILHNTVGVNKSTIHATTINNNSNETTAMPKINYDDDDLSNTVSLNSP